MYNLYLLLACTSILYGPLLIGKFAFTLKVYQVSGCKSRTLAVTVSLFEA